MDFLTFFDVFKSEDSTIFLIFNIFFFLFGFILAWLLWGGRARRYRRELESVKGKLLGAETELGVAKEQLEKHKKITTDLEANLEETKQNFQSVQLAYDRMRAQYRALEEKNGQLEEMVESYETNMEALNEQVLGLRMRNTQLAEEQAAGGANAEETVEGLAEMQSSYNATIQRLSAFEEKLENLEQYNEKLRLEVEDLKAGGAPLELGAIAPAVTKGETVDPKVAQKSAKKKLSNAIGKKIPKAKAKHKDDLKLINGVGPFIEKQLNGLGIYTFQQVASFDEEIIDLVTSAIAFFPGRIVRDDWVGQAKRLAEIKADAPDALKTSAVFPKDNGDLKIIEGVGPKIEKVLKKVGIKSWEDLAKAKPNNLKDLLLKAGDRYRMHNPTTWPRQAQLAVDGSWEELKEYQDYLKGGREQ